MIPYQRTKKSIEARVDLRFAPYRPARGDEEGDGRGEEGEKNPLEVVPCSAGGGLLGARRPPGARARLGLEMPFAREVRGSENGRGSECGERKREE